MSVYNSLNYREILKILVKNRKAVESKFGFHKLAEAAKIQKPYMSKVMNESANLSSDQMYSICMCLGLDEDQTDYLQTCLEYARTGLSERKKFLSSKLNSIMEKHLDSREYISSKAVEINESISDYYLDPMLQIVHIGFSIPEYSKNPKKFSEALKISGGEMHHYIFKLEKMCLLERDGDFIKSVDTNLHLPKTAPIFKAWRNQLKLLTIQKLNSPSQNDSPYSFSTVFSANEATRQKIQKKFLQLLSECEKDVADAKAEKLYQMSFDLFSWV